MKKFGYIMIAMVLFGIAFSSRAIIGNTGKPQTMYSEMVMITDRGTSTMISYINGKDYRMEMYQGKGKDKKLTSIHIMKEGSMWMLMPENKTGMKMSANSPMGGGKEGAKPKESSWDKVMKDEQDKGMKVENRGKEKWEGAEYEVWRITDPKTGIYTDYYKDSNNMVKRMVNYGKNGKMVSDSRFIKTEMGKPLPVGIFDIPADYKITDMSQMKIPNMPGMNKQP